MKTPLDNVIEFAVFIYMLIIVGGLAALAAVATLFSIGYAGYYLFNLLR